MIVCRSCGRRNADADEFCGGCSAFLEYDGEPLAAEVQPEPAGDDPPPGPAPAPGREQAQPVLRRPGHAVPGARVRRGPEPVLDRAPPRAGELVCGECGWGNDPGRRFCRHCGASIVTAEVVPDPWYRRLLPRRRQLAAGERPARVRRRMTGEAAAPVRLLRAARNVLALALVAVVAAVALVPPLRSGVGRAVAPVVSEVRKLAGQVELPPPPSR